MSNNRSGFTMIELLAAVVILGIMMGIAIPTVMSVLNDQRNDTYVEDAIRLATNMDYKMRSDNKMPVPARGACIAMNLTYLDNNTFNDAPYDGEYDMLASFVVAKRNTVAASDIEYFYYVRLIEQTKTGAYRGINLKSVEKLYESDAKDKYVSNLDESSVKNLNSYSQASLKSLVNGSSYSIGCSSIIIYAPDASE